MTSRPVVGSRVIVAGNLGYVVVDHPDDAYLTYKVRFVDGRADWFKEDIVVVDDSPVSPGAKRHRCAEQDRTSSEEEIACNGSCDLESDLASTADTEVGSSDKLDLAAVARTLRDENERLRRDLLDSQREVQRLVHEKHRDDLPAVDFGHILALARELNDECDDAPGLQAMRQNDGAASVFAIHSPRGQANESLDECGLLRQELDASQAELADMRSRYEARDADLRAKFASLMRVCVGSSGLGDGHLDDPAAFSCKKLVDWDEEECV